MPVRGSPCSSSESQSARADLASLDSVLGESIRLLTEARSEALAGASDIEGAEATRGARDYVEPGQRIDEVTGAFFKKIDQPALGDYTICSDWSIR